MRMFRMIRLRLRSVLRSRRVEQELDAELRHHLDRLIEVHRRAGLSPSAARAAAIREFGNVMLIREQCRDTRGVSWIEDARRDLRYAFRSMSGAPGYAATAILSLGLAIGLNTAVFNLLDAVLLRRLPVDAPERLVLIEGMHETVTSIISYPMYRDLAERQQVFSEVVASRDYLSEPLRVRAGGAGAARAVRGGAVSANYFSALGLSPSLGRLFVPGDDDPNDPASVAVVSYDFWMRELGGSPLAVGQSLRINEESFTVVGVAPEGFRGLSIDGSPEVWVPLTKFRSTRDLANRDGTFFKLVGRLKPGVTIPQAQAAMAQLFRALRAEELQTRGVAGTRGDGYHIVLRPGDKGFDFFRERLARTLSILMAMAAVLVAIVGINLTTLLSARVAARRHEFAVRRALGASRRRLVQQVITEHVVLAACAGGLALVVAVWASRMLLGFVSTDVARHSAFNRYVPEGLQLQLDVGTIAVTQGVALLAALVLALAPVLSLNHPELITALRGRIGSAWRLGSGPLRVSVRKLFVVLQVALSVTLLVGAGLMVRTVLNLRAIDPGFDRENVLLVDIDVTGTGRTGARLTALERSVHERLSTLPGVRSASLSMVSLFSDYDRRMGVGVDAAVPPVTDERPAARMDVVSADYFETIGMSVVAGRTFAARDDEAAAPVAVVNEAFVDRFFPDENPIGRRILVGGDPETASEIVGVIRDAKYNDLREGTREMFYLSLLQTPIVSARSIQVRTDGPPQALVPQIRRVLDELDSDIVITESKTLADQVDRTLARERLLVSLSSFFGAAALLLACIGLYGLLAYQVVQRTQEIGLRLALGSSMADVLWLVLRDALLLVGIGAAFGVTGALGLSGVISNQLFGITPSDPATIAAVVAILTAVAGLSCYLPARRAARVDPMVALGSE